MCLFFALIYMFYELFKLIGSGHNLSKTLQHQKPGLQMMMALVCISYLLSAIIFAFYGTYRQASWLSWYKRWLIYPCLVIVIELPNMLVIYIIHWQSYRPKP